MIYRALVFIIAISTAPLANADWDFSAIDDGTWYIGAQASYATVASRFGDGHPSSLHVLGGYQVNPYLGVETRVGLGLLDDETGDNINKGIETYYGLYLTGTVPVSDWVNVYALAGFANISLDRNFDPQDQDDSKSDFSYGAGVSVRATEKVWLTLEAIQWIDRGNFDVSAINLGFRYDF